MPRKPKKGYFVSGQFVAEGSELDLELKRELKGSDEPSRTDRKRESTELQKLGEELLTLRGDLTGRLLRERRAAPKFSGTPSGGLLRERRAAPKFSGTPSGGLLRERRAAPKFSGTPSGGLAKPGLGALTLPDKLVDAIDAAKKITNFEGKRRQMQFIGKLMRQLDADALDTVRAVLAQQHGGSASETLALHQIEQWRDKLIEDDTTLQDWVNQYPQSDSQQMRALIRQARRDAQPGQAGATPRHGKAYRELFQLVRAQLHDPKDNDEPPAHASSRPDI